jgi:hypothetical protein
MSHSPGSDTPAKDDVIIRPAADSSGRFILGTLRAPRQFLCVSYDEATAKAGTYAKTSKVRVWRTDDGRTYTPVPMSAMARADTTRGMRRTGS